MKKFNLMSLAVALLLVFSSIQNAHAITYTVTSQDSYTDDLGNSKKEVIGTIAFDSDYPCDLTTLRCGENILPTSIGLTTIDQMTITPMVVGGNQTGAGLFFFKHHSDGTSGSGGTTGSIRAYYSNAIATAKGLASAPTYDLSALTSVPFRAIGSI